MTDQEILEGNKSICTFMNNEEKIDAVALWFWVHEPEKEFGRWIKPQHLKYHKSWDWLMPVIERISQHRYRNIKDETPDNFRYAWPVTFGMISENGMPMFRIKYSFLHEDETLIKAAYSGVIEWLNFFKEEEIIYDPIVQPKQ